MNDLYLRQEHIECLYNIFNSYCPKAEIVAYGSRISGNCHDGSDLDLAVISFHDPEKNLSELKTLISDSNIPFLIDILEYETVPPSFQKEIKRKNILLYKGI